MTLTKNPADVRASAARFDRAAHGRGLSLALAGGGTGGHIVPGLSLVEWARAHGETLERPLSSVLWFLSGRPVEERVLGTGVLDEGVDLERVPLALEPRDGGAPTRTALAWRTGPALVQARAALKRQRADVLLGLGGYTSLPAVLAARSLGLPVALLEVNSRPGTATRWLGRLADVVLYVWPEEGLGEGLGRPRRRCIGPPLAPRFLRGAPDAVARGAARTELGLDPGAPVLLVLGGSQGAESLNRFVRAHVEDLVGSGVQVIHQTGPGRAGDAVPLTGYHPIEYVDRVDRALAAATVVLCRGGASTLAEVAALRRPAFVVPYPHHKDQHQEHNARALGAGVRIVRDEALDARLCHELVRMCLPNAGPERRSMSDALERAVPIDDTRSGAARLYNELCDLSSARRT